MRILVPALMLPLVLAGCEDTERLAVLERTVQAERAKVVELETRAAEVETLSARVETLTATNRDLQTKLAAAVAAAEAGAATVTRQEETIQALTQRAQDAEKRASEAEQRASRLNERIASLEDLDKSIEALRRSNSSLTEALEEARERVVKIEIETPPASTQAGAQAGQGAQQTALREPVALLLVKLRDADRRLRQLGRSDDERTVNEVRQLRSDLAEAGRNVQSIADAARIDLNELED